MAFSFTESTTAAGAEHSLKQALCEEGTNRWLHDFPCVQYTPSLYFREWGPTPSSVRKEEMKRRIKAGREDTFPNEWERESHLGVQGVTVERSMGVGTQRFWGRGGAVAPFSQSSGGGGLPVSFVKQTACLVVFFVPVYLEFSTGTRCG